MSDRSEADAARRADRARAFEIARRLWAKNGQDPKYFGRVLSDLLAELEGEGIARQTGVVSRWLRRWRNEGSLGRRLS